jgi:DNA-nicking Smr family endonuclease
VLKNKVRHWLMQREDVLAFCQARTVDGGAGAVVVLLKSSSR